MGISELRHMRAQGSGARVPINPLGRELVRAGKISRSDATLAEMVRRHCDTSLDRILQAEGLATEDDLLAAHARRLSSTRLSAEDVMRAELVESGLDPRFLLKHGVLPIQSAAGVPVLATGGPDSLASLRPALPRKLDRARVVMAPRHAIQDRIAHEHRDILLSMAEARVPEIESCRTCDVAPCI